MYASLTYKAVAQKRSGKPRKTWDKVLSDNINMIKKLGMDTADPQNRLE